MSQGQIPSHGWANPNDENQITSTALASTGSDLVDANKDVCQQHQSPPDLSLVRKGPPPPYNKDLRREIIEKHTAAQQEAIRRHQQTTNMVNPVHQQIVHLQPAVVGQEGSPMVQPTAYPVYQQMIQPQGIHAQVYQQPQGGGTSGSVLVALPHQQQQTTVAGAHQPVFQHAPFQQVPAGMASWQSAAGGYIPQPQPVAIVPAQQQVSQPQYVTLPAGYSQPVTGPQQVQFVAPGGQPTSVYHGYGNYGTTAPTQAGH